MKVEFINPFVGAASSVLSMVAGTDVEKGRLFLRPSPFASHEVTIIVGVTGKVKGQVIYGMPLETAKSLASAMMMGMPVEVFDEMAKSAISELANMITGNAGIGLSEAGYTCDVTPPTLITGSEMKISTVDIQALVIHLITKYGEIEVNVALKEK